VLEGASIPRWEAEDAAKGSILSLGDVKVEPPRESDDKIEHANQALTGGT
jgi:hypothetical protein